MMKNTPLSTRLKTKFMGRFFIFLSIFLIGLILLAGCSKNSEINAALGGTATLAPGQTVSITDASLKVKFLEVVNDSRCATGVECFWEGEVSALVEITQQGSTDSLVLTKRASGIGTEGFNEFEISFEVTPYPQADKQISKKDYRLKITVTKKEMLSGGILVTFQVVNESYRVFITNPDTIAQVFAVERGESSATIPSGKLLSGAVPYNQPWSWHIDSEDIQMAEFTIELCDGTPSLVGADLNYWIDTVQRFCPWSAQISKIEDYR